MSLLDVRNLRKSFRTTDAFGRSKGRLVAVDDVSFTLQAGETLGLVGESGCGKSTTGKLVMQLLQAEQGEVLFEGTDLRKLTPRQMRPYRRQIQMIFQDPFSSLNPRMTVTDILSEPFIIHKLAPKREIRDRVIQLLEKVGLKAEHELRYAHEFSGGQRQRIGIARALAVQPKLIIADEPVSALDLSVQAQILNLLREIQQENNLSYLFIAHDLSVIEHVSNRIAVMYLGRIVETAGAEDLYRSPQHPYTEALLNAVPLPDPGHPRPIPLTGEIPSPIDPPSGCHFHPRCPYADEKCRSEAPILTASVGNRQVACHHFDQVGRYLRHRS
ncbi:peptide/nickel transport system ATP-binding protein [Malonomonas rubra DSM 5091]|uniref:Peptide/nickel transport system ATP-binding protein n=1 Tax=Malonomonas rubra DSM 5091 TaxID=1122189 RepID=A0A1M6BIB9_MALRU|nr:oligopeptide/dipeptide ABC transporter ATP-binding protein [Malonomonas rubra]SHI48482.1 peptide/nickel transport system ATP-binding protein [Malonomonas rubra DSM 5091]